MSQAKRDKASRKAKAKAESRVAELVSGAKKRTRKSIDHVTLEDIVRERDENGLSWAQVAINLDLGSPGAARSAYEKLTGRHHSESNPVARRAPSSRSGLGVRPERRKTFVPKWDDESDQDDIASTISNRVITVVTECYGSERAEEIAVGRIVKFTFDGKDEDGPLVIHFHDKYNGASRSIRVADIKNVR